MAFGYWKTGKMLKEFGHYRVKEVGRVAALRNDGLSQAHYLALGTAETLLSNIESYLDEDGKPVKETGGRPSDAGWAQINRKWNRDALRRMPAVRAGTWRPIVEGKTPYDKGFCPRFKEGLEFTHKRFGQAMIAVTSAGVPRDERVRVVLASHNAGIGGAIKGWREGDPDKYTHSGHYSEWMLGQAKVIRRWLFLHPRWKP